MNISTLKYTGVVSVKLLINDKIIELKDHNSGEPYLMKTFCKYLTGNYAGQSDVPCYLDLRRYSSGQWLTYLTQRVPLSGKEYLYDNSLKNWVAKFTGAISYSNIISGTISSSDEFRLYLLSGYDSSDPSEHYHDMAYKEIDGSDIALIVQGTQGIVEWVMQISN